MVGLHKRNLSFLRKIVFSCVMLVLFYCAVEMIFTIFLAKTAPRTVTLRKLPQSDVVFHEPNQDFIDTKYARCHYHVTINSFGFRGKEISLKKPTGTIRIAILGDSFVYGEGENDYNTLSWHLERLLNKNYPPNRFEVLNAGRFGWSICNELEFYKDYVKKFNPDIVILAYSWNDILDLIKGSIHSEKTINDSPAWFRPIIEKSNFVRYLIYRYAKYKAWQKSKLFYTKYGEFNLHLKIESIPEGRSPLCERAIELYKINLLNLRGMVENNASKFVFIIFPTKINERKILRDMGKELETFASVNQINVVNLRPLWLSKNKNIASFFNPTEHPTGEAFRTTAKVLAGFLNEKGFTRK